MPCACHDWASCIKILQVTYFPMFSQEKRPFHMVNQKHRYDQLMPVSQELIFIWWFDSITHFACQKQASQFKISQITYFSCVFSAQKTLEHGESKT
jgi:hypothetical protein